jgi:hypothetical protein
VHRKSNNRVIFDALRGFPGTLPAIDAEHREMLIEELEANTADESLWTRFLLNERNSLDRVGHSESLDGRFKIARQFLSARTADVMEVEVRYKDASEKRAAFAAMSNRAVVSSRLFVAWAELERGEKALDRARELIELGIKVGVPSSPGQSRLHRELDRIKDEQQAALMQQQQQKDDEAGTVKKSRTSLPARRRLLGSIGGPARIKAGEQKQIVEEEAPAAESAVRAEPVRLVHFPPPPLSPLTLSESDEGSSVVNRKGNRVKFASPAPAPAGPRVAAPRPGSMSPAPASTAGGQGILTAMRNRLSLAGTEGSPKPSDEVNLSETPIRHGRGEKGAEAGIRFVEQEVKPTPSRVLFQSAIKPRFAVEDSAVPSVIISVAPPAHAIDAGAPVVVPPRTRTSPAAENGFYDPGDDVVLGQRQLKVLTVMGTGGYSRVYKVLDCKTQELFALKDLNRVADKEDKSYQNETAILNRLKSLQQRDPSIRNRVVEMIECQETPERCFLLLELAEIDLTRVLVRARRERKGMMPLMDMTEIKFYWAQMLRCLAVLHEHGIVHCDLKPPNFAVFQGRMKLIDFGIAAQTAKREIQTCGTVTYLPPELCATLSTKVAHAPAHPSRDIWGLGCILFEFAYGHAPFQAVYNACQRDNFKYFRLMSDPKIISKIPFNNSTTALVVLNKCVSACLQYLPNDRPTANGLLQHEFLDE